MDTAIAILTPPAVIAVLYAGFYFFHVLLPGWVNRRVKERETELDEHEKHIS